MQENVPLNSSKLNPDKNQQADKNKIKSVHTSHREQHANTCNLSQRGLKAGFPKDLLKALTETVPPAFMCVRLEYI